MSDSIEEHLKDELNPGETIEWCGKPFEGLFIEKEDLFILIPMIIHSGFVLFGLSIFLLHDISLSGFALYLLLVGIFFSPIFAMIFGKLIIGPKRRKKTAYAVTNQRILIKSWFDMLNIKSLNLDGLKEINVRVRKNGMGTIRFGNSVVTPWISQRIVLQYFLVERTIDAPEFEMIEDVQKVYGLIKKLQIEKVCNQLP